MLLLIIIVVSIMIKWLLLLVVLLLLSPTFNPVDQGSLEHCDRIIQKLLLGLLENTIMAGGGDSYASIN